MITLVTALACKQEAALELLETVENTIGLGVNLNTWADVKKAAEKFRRLLDAPC